MKLRSSPAGSTPTDGVEVVASTLTEEGGRRSEGDERSRRKLAIRRAIGPAHLDPEGALVFQLARARSEGLAPHSFAKVADWRRLLLVASDENAIIALRDSVKRVSGRSLPAGMERYIAMLALDRESRMRQLERRLEQTLIALNGAGIDVILLKGGALACTVYGSFVGRPMRDIDILVRPDRADEARAVLLGREWSIDPDVPGDGSYGTHHHLPPLRDAGGSGLRLEIHRALLPDGHPFRFTDDEIWTAARPARVGQGRAFIMDPVHHAVHLAIHFSWSHMLRMGAWHAFRDLGALVSAGLLDWNDFAETAARWGAASCSYWTLRLGLELSDLPVPDEVLRRLDPGLSEVIARPLLRHFVNCLAQSDQNCPSVRLDQTLWSVAMQPRREGHGRIRPWSVSLDLLFAIRERVRMTSETLSGSPLLQMRRAGRYLSQLLA